MSRWWGVLLLAACGGGEAKLNVAADTAVAPAPDAGAVTIAAGPKHPGPATEPRLEGHDFTPQALALWAVAACAQGAAIPASIDAALVEKHCARLRAAEDSYRTSWLDVAMPWFARTLPAGLPATLVYPFGGGDLVTALATYPHVTEITSISLEGMGDPRVVERMTPKELRGELALNAAKIGLLLGAAYNRTVNLNDVANAQLGGLLVFALVALDVHGYEPVSLRYFTLQDDGKLHYMTDEDLAAVDADLAKHRKKKEKQFKQLQVSHFNNAELRFRKKGDAAAPVRIYRHIAQNLSDRSLRREPGLMAHLAGKGRIVAIGKATHYLMWHLEFSVIRDYLLANMDLMVSDDSGIPGRFATRAGFVQDTYGKNTGAFGHPSKDIQAENVALWKENEYRELPFVFGYRSRGQNQLMITRKPAGN